MTNIRGSKLSKEDITEDREKKYEKTHDLKKFTTRMYQIDFDSFKKISKEFSNQQEVFKHILEVYKKNI